jgi:hypothetical protein
MDPDPDPTLISYQQAHYLQLLKFCVKILFCKHYFSLLNAFMRKGKNPDSLAQKHGSPTFLALFRGSVAELYLHDEYVQFQRIKQLKVV